MGYLKAHLRLLQHQALQVCPAHHGKLRGLHGLRVGLPELLGGQSHLPEDRTGLNHGQSELPPLPEHEEPLTVILGGVEDLRGLEMNIGKLAVELLYLLRRERLEDVD